MALQKALTTVSAKEQNPGLGNGSKFPAKERDLITRIEEHMVGDEWRQGGRQLPTNKHDRG
jgi:hypothetical protein